MSANSNLPTLCYGCGTCAGVCPNNAIHMKLDLKKGLYTPKIDEDQCNNCGLCIQVCPWLFLDKNRMELFVFNRQSKSILGNYIRCYSGYSHNPRARMRNRFSSGGLVTTLLVFALREGLIDGALVTGMKKRGIFIPKPFIAKTEEEIASAAGSKYINVPLNCLIKEILAHKGEFAVVGLPCHIQGIRKAERSSIGALKKLNEKMKIHLGLFCSGAMSIHGTNTLVRSLGVDYGKVSELHYRGYGWPGGFGATLENGDHTAIIPYDDYFSLLRFYLSPSCVMCWDNTNEFSDISFGDAWFELLKGSSSRGLSLAVSRTRKGEELLKAAKKKEIIDLHKISLETVMESHGKDTLFTKKNLTLRRSLIGAVEDKVPNFQNVNDSKLFDIVSKTTTLLRFLRSLLMSDGRCRRFVDPMLTCFLREKVMKNERVLDGSNQPIK